MIKIIFSLFIFQFSILSTVFAQDTTKLILDHSVYNGWKVLKNQKISADGKRISYEIGPQKGDGNLYFYDKSGNKCDTINRGYDAAFSALSDLAVFKIKPQDDSTRQAKIKKKNKDQMPRDTLGIYLFANKSLLKIPDVKSYILPNKQSSFVAYLSDKKDTSASVKDTLVSVYEMSVFNPLKSVTTKFKSVSEYIFSKNGYKLAYISNKKKLKENNSEINIFEPDNEKNTNLFKTKGFIRKLSFNEDGNKLAYLYSKDTSKVKRYGLYILNTGSAPVKLADTGTAGMINNYEISLNDSLFFSKDGKRIFFFTAPKVLPEPKDTIPDDEKCKVDVWNWQDPELQTQQVHDLEKNKKKTYLAMYDFDKGNMYQVSDSVMQDVKLSEKGNGKYALGISYKPYLQLGSWEDASYKDYYVINLETNEKKLALEKKKYTVDISPDGNFIVWYETSDSSYYSYSVKSGETYNLTKSLDVKFYDEESDVPNDPAPYGIASWTKKSENPLWSDSYVLLYDKYDIWKVHPENKFEPENITKSRINKSDISYRYIKLNEEEQWHNPDEQFIVKGTNRENFSEGIYSINLKSGAPPIEMISGECSFISLAKSKSAESYTWQKMTYREYPDLWTGNGELANAIKISDANPQTGKYSWGTVEFVNWKSFEGKDMKGILYKPDNFDSTKKYPMIAYFYEKYTDKIHSHYIPNPSRSVINFPLYNSTGYIVFIPDITYTIGHPGKSAYDAIVSGTQYLVAKGFVDEKKMGIQGQSWGGYQAAYLVTQTGMYAAAMAGAPVSNMTSAYGGIRWESGVNRIFQYEQGQSRIGGTLWDKFDLYVENSPLFYADKVTTPLLIMANDNDGSVPWQQGIEYFASLRRLGKPSWMLTYNGDEHNLIKWSNRVDLAIRMKQFFDHYLKDAPAPLWMTEGIPALQKGLKTGYELEK